jgi:hypothetical protein
VDFTQVVEVEVTEVLELLAMEAQVVEETALVALVILLGLLIQVAAEAVLLTMCLLDLEQQVGQV